MVARCKRNWTGNLFFKEKFQNRFKILRPLWRVNEAKNLKSELNFRSAHRVDSRHNLARLEVKLAKLSLYRLVILNDRIAVWEFAHL